MVAVGRGMMGRTKIHLLDEPSQSLDPMLVDKFFKAIRRTNEERTMILLIEQDGCKAPSIVTGGYVLQKGEIVVQESRKNSAKKM